jgi:hypothetical protein
VIGQDTEKNESKDLRVSVTESMRRWDGGRVERKREREGDVDATTRWNSSCASNATHCRYVVISLRIRAHELHSKGIAAHAVGLTPFLSRPLPPPPATTHRRQPFQQPSSIILFKIMVILVVLLPRVVIRLWRCCVELIVGIKLTIFYLPYI